MLILFFMRKNITRNIYVRKRNIHYYVKICTANKTLPINKLSLSLISYRLVIKVFNFKIILLVKNKYQVVIYQ